MRLRAIAYVCMFVLLLSSVSDQILAAPVVAVSSSPGLEPRRFKLFRSGFSKYKSQNIKFPAELVLKTGLYTSKVKETHGTLTGFVPGSLYVIRVEGFWSQGPREAVVAKFFPKGNSEGARIEMEKFRMVDQLVDWGFDGEGTQWVITKSNPGRRKYHFDRLSSWKDFGWPRLNETLCQEYMGKIREAIVAASSTYLKLPGAPMGSDLHRYNILFLEERTGKDLDQLKLTAYFTDWSTVSDLHTHLADKNQMADDSQVEDFKNQLKTELEKGNPKQRYPDFSNRSNCRFNLKD